MIAGRSGRSARTVAAAAGLMLVAVMACAGASHNRRDDDRDHAVVTFDCPVGDAEVWVDGRFLPDGLRRGIAVAPGHYRLEIRHDRYHTLYLEVTLVAGERRVVTARPAEILP